MRKETGLWIICLFASLFALVLTIIVFTLTVIIMKETLDSASIATNQFGDGVSLYEIFVTTIILGIFNLFAIFIWGTVFCSMYISALVFSISSLLITASLEGITYKFISCFNYDYANNQLVVARSCINILLMILFITLTIICMTEIKCEARSRGFTLLRVLVYFLFCTAPYLTFMSLSIVTMAKLKPTIEPIVPSSFFVSYFNQTEINAIDNGIYSLNSAISSDRHVGNLGQILYSENKQVYTTDCSNSNSRTVKKNDNSNNQTYTKNIQEKSTTCIDYYVHFYSFEVNCSVKRTQQESVFYRDCQSNDTLSLTVLLEYFDGKDDYPIYNCMVNKVQQTSASNCTWLYLSNYELILVQTKTDSATNLTSIRRAWWGFSNCNSLPNIKLTHKVTLYSYRPSNNATFSSPNILVCFIIVLITIYCAF